jgi:hypothetical protein
MDSPSNPINTHRNRYLDAAATKRRARSAATAQHTASAGGTNEMECMLERELPHLPPKSQFELVEDIEVLCALSTQGLLTEDEARFYSDRLEEMLEGNSSDMNKKDLDNKRGRDDDCNDQDAAFCRSGRPLYL